MMAKKVPKMPPKGMHEMKGGKMMKDSDMPGTMGKGAAKPKFGTPEFFAGLKKGRGKKVSKKRTRGGKK